MIDENIQTIISNRRNKMIGQFKLDMMSISISTVEATARAHGKVIRDEKERLLSAKCAQHVDSIIINNILNAIQARQENITKRAQYVTECKVSFFDETPAMLID